MQKRSMIVRKKKIIGEKSILKSMEDKINMMKNNRKTSIIKKLKITVFLNALGFYYDLLLFHAPLH